LEGTLGVEVSVVSDLGIFGKDYEVMGVISVEDVMDGMNSGERLWNKEEAGAYRFKSSPLAPNTQEVKFTTSVTLHERLRTRGLGARPTGLP